MITLQFNLERYKMNNEAQKYWNSTEAKRLIYQASLTQDLEDALDLLIDAIHCQDITNHEHEECLKDIREIRAKLNE